jgi:Holliday junction resolvasome RuvABC endonuclease subunit
MIKLSLKKLERNLGLKLRKNVMCLGVDTASTTGLALISTFGGKVIIDYSIFKLPTIPRKIADQMEKAEKYEQAMDSALNLIRDYKKEMKVKSPSILVLEQSFLFKNPETFGYLRGLQGVFYSELYDSFDEIKIYLPTVTRKLVGFHSLLPRGTKTEIKKKEICDWASKVVGEEIKDHNIADAILLSLAGLKI